MPRPALLSSLADGSRRGALHLRWLALGVAGLIGFAPAGGADTYQDWKTRVFTEAEQADPAISGETALSPAGDGLTNLLKYAFGIDPHVEDFLALPQIGSVQAVDPATGQPATFATITRRVSAANPPVDLYFVPELSSDLQVWRRGDATFAAPVTHPPGGDFDLVTSQTLLPRGQHLFLRLRVLEGQTLPDDWQMQYFGQTGIDPTADSDGDGQSNFDEFLHGTDPTDYYNGKTPILEIVSGDDQEAEASQFLLQPLVVEITDDHGGPFRNAPVTFNAPTGLLATTVGGDLHQTLSTRTDNNGLATVYFVTPNQVDAVSTVTAATIFNHNSSTTVQFTAATLAPDNLATAIYGASLVLHLDGTLVSWGIIPGDGGTSRDWPEPLALGPTVAAVSAGRAHLVVLDTAGLVRAWGENEFGQIGDDTTDDKSQPVLVPNLSNVTAIAAGGMHTLALQQDQTVMAWGANYYGQLGTGDTDQSAAPIAVSGLTSVMRIAGGYERSLALKSDGTVWTWGFESEYPDTDDTIYDLVPVQVAGLTNMTAIAAGRAHAVAVKEDGTVWAWGSNSAGQLGNGANTFSATPVQVSGMTNAIHVSSSYDHTLAILSDGTVMAWGSNTFGQLGDGTTNPTNVPVQVAGLTNVVAVIAAESYSMALQSDGTIWTWGQVNFEGGLGAWGNTFAPQQVALGLLDENGNGMDDRWELLYFHNLDQTANGDFNGNGISNLDEWLAGKDPTFWDPNNDGTVHPPVPANPSLVLADDGTRALAWDLDGNESNSFIIERKVGPGGGWLEINRTGAGATSYVDTASLSSPAYLLYRIRSLDNASRISLPTSNLSVPRPLAPSRLSLTNNMDGTVTLTWTNREPRATSVIIESRNATGDGAVGWTQVATVAGNASSYTGNLDPNGTYRTRTTGPADLLSPPSNQVPQLPTRFAILDLGTSARPSRVANNGTVLLDSGGDFSIAGYRWNLGPLEVLSTFGGHAYDMNNDGTVVGSSYVGSYSAGAIWPVGSSSPNILPDPYSFGDSGYQYAYILAVNDSGAMYGGILDTPVAGDGYSATASAWRSKIGTLQATDPDSSSTFGYALEPFKMNNHGSFLGTFIDYDDGIFATTINYQIASFTPVDINDEGMVIGNGDSVDSQLADGFTDILSNGASAEVIDVGSAFYAMSSGTSPQIVGLDHGEQELWEKDPITGDYESTNLNELIPPDSGWDLDIPIDNHYNQSTMAMSRNGLIAGRGFYQPVDPNGQPVGSPYKEAFLLLPVEVMRVWSDQLPGVEANYLADAQYNGQDSIGTGLDNKNYIFLGAAQSNNFDGKGHIKAQVVIPGPDQLRNKILWRLAKYDELGNLIVASGSSSYADYDANSKVVSVAVDNPADDDTGTDYILVGGYDANANGQLDASEANIIPTCLFRGQRLPFEIKLVSTNRYNTDLNTLESDATGWISSLLPHAAGMLNAFATQTVPSEATSSEPTTVDRLEPGLDHPVGILFNASQSSTAWGPPLNNTPLPHAGPGPSITAVFAATTQMSEDVVNSTTMNNWLQTQLSMPANSAIVRQYFTTHPDENFATLYFDLSGPMDFAVNSVPVDVDLGFAFGKVSVAVNVEVEVDRGYNVSQIALTGSMKDLFDFNFDGFPTYLTHPAASVQAGYNTLGVGGRVYKSRVEMNNSVVTDFQFQFPE